MGKILIILTSVTILLGITAGGLYFFKDRIPALGKNTANSNSDNDIDSFEKCLEADNPVQESYPRRCTEGNQTFTEDIGNELDKMNLIQSESPRPNQLITSPLEVMGTARGYWYFEANFPVVLYDEQGEIIAQGIAEAADEWMTEDFVPFSLTLTFTQPSSSTGSLVLQKSNPSGLPENEDELRIPVRFK